MSKIKVMIVEDELITAEALAVLLKKLGYDPITIVSSGEEAISKVENLKVDLILMDIILAGTIDGIEAATIINKNYSIPIIFITAYGDKNTLNRAKLSESYGYIVKPITNENEILPTIEFAIHNYKIKNKLNRDIRKFEQIKQLIQVDKSFLDLQESNSIERINRAEKDMQESVPLLEVEPNDEQKKFVKMLKSISNFERFSIIEVLKIQSLKLEEIEILINKSQSTTSHHIKNLEKSGYIKGWKNGKYTYYSINKSRIMEFSDLWEVWLNNLSNQ